MIIETKGEWRQQENSFHSNDLNFWFKGYMIKSALSFKIFLTLAIKSQPFSFLSGIHQAAQPMTIQSLSKLTTNKCFQK